MAQGGVNYYDGTVAYDETTHQPKYVLRDGKWQPYGSDGQPAVPLTEDANKAIGNARTAAQTQMNAAPMLDRFLALNRIRPTGPAYQENGNILDPLAWINQIQARRDKNGGPEFQEMEGITKQMIPLRHVTQGPMTDADARNYEKSLPSVGQWGRTNAAAAAGMRAMAKNQQGYSEFLQDYAARHAGQVLGADEEWMRYMTANPVYGGDGSVTANRPMWRDWFSANQLPRVMSNEDYARLPKGPYIAPDGSKRIKK